MRPAIETIGAGLLFLRVLRLCFPYKNQDLQISCRPARKPVQADVASLLVLIDI